MGCGWGCRGRPACGPETQMSYRERIQGQQLQPELTQPPLAPPTCPLSQSLPPRQAACSKTPALSITEGLLLITDAAASTT